MSIIVGKRMTGMLSCLLQLDSLETCSELHCKSALRDGLPLLRMSQPTRKCICVHRHPIGVLAKAEKKVVGMAL
jgi:hypothetical protein